MGMSMRRIRKKSAGMLAAVMLLAAACGKDAQKPDGLVSMDAVKGYEHTARVEEEPEPTEPGNVPTPPVPTGAGQPGPGVGDHAEEDGYETTNDTVYVAVSKLNLRTQPSTDSEVVSQAVYGDSFTRLAKGSGEWDKLEYNGQVVYAFAEYLTTREIKKQTGTGLEQFVADAKKKMNIVDTAKQIYSYSDLCEDLEALKTAYPGKLDYKELAVTADGRKVFAVVAGNPDADRAIIIQAGIHAREYMTSQLVMNQLEFYLAYADEGDYGQRNAGAMLDEVAVWIVPMANPDGIAISQYGMDGIREVSIRSDVQEWYRRDRASGATIYTFADYLKYWKANARGVDLNRNFDYGFREYVGAAEPGAQKYKGSAAGSEAETAALVRLTEEVKPVLTISYHATGSVIYWDYGQTGELRERCESMVKKISQVNGNEIRYASSDKQDAAGYGDWCVMSKGIPSATIEIGVGTAPLGISEYSDIWKRNALMWAALMEFALK